MERFLTSRGPSRVGGWSSIFKRFLQSNGFEGQVQLQHHFFTSKVAPKHKQIPVLFIHGLLASGRTYRSFVKRKDFGKQTLSENFSGVVHTELLVESFGRFTMRENKKFRRGKFTRSI
mmetsp:Transcript_4094/g.17099  ORF Transcript_4094/g.17099 Transcript_4094/m.17099 type:complete len:118 (+) Transcript_4094:110-463(+)